MVREEIHQSDAGTTIRRTMWASGVVLNVSGATTKQIIIVKPDGTKLTKTATFTTDGTDGKIQYVAVAGDLDQPGDYHVQVHLVFPEGEWSSTVDEFTVHRNL